MTLASECVVANELGLAYAAVCVVDNMANGIEGKPIEVEELEDQRERNADRACATPSTTLLPELEAVSGADGDRGPPRRGEGRAALQRRGRSRRSGPRWRPRRATRRSTPAARR